MLLTGEVGATRAVASVLKRCPNLAVRWLKHVGVPCEDVADIRVEEPQLAKSRRADISLVARCGPGAGTVIIEAKLDAPVDLWQLQDAAAAAQHVISLIPAGIHPPQVDGVLGATWEDLLTVMRSEPEPDAVALFVADELELLLDSPRIAQRRRLAQLVSNTLPPGWSFNIGESAAGGALLNIQGPDRDGRQAAVEISNRNRGKVTPFRATVMACSFVDSNDPLIWRALAQAAKSAAQLPSGLLAGKRGKRTEPERSAAQSAGVPLAWTYGFGERQFDNYGWAGFGPRLELTDEDMPETLIAHAAEVAETIDAALSATGVAS